MKGVLFRRTLALFVLVLLLADIALLGAYSYFGRKTYIDLELDSLDSVMNSAKGIYEVRDDMFSSQNSFSRSLGFLSSTADVKYYYFYYGSSGIEAVTNIAAKRPIRYPGGADDPQEGPSAHQQHQRHRGRPAPLRHRRHHHRGRPHLRPRDTAR